MAPDEDIKHYYETYWSAEGFNPLGRVIPALATLFEENVAPGSSCLDIGCGDGRTSGPWLLSHGCRYLGLDISEHAVQEARKQGFDAEVIKDANALPVPDQSIDVAVCVEVLEHLFAPKEAAKEIYRVLRPGGRLIATVPNIVYWKRRVGSLLGRWNPGGDLLAVDQPWRDPHVRFFTVSSLERMLAQVGFWSVEVRGHEGWNPVPTPFRRPSERHLIRFLPSLFAVRLNVVAVKKD